jgi:hypothetical protein
MQSAAFVNGIIVSFSPQTRSVGARMRASGSSKITPKIGFRATIT